MIATETFLLDELIEIAIGTAVSQLPAALFYVAGHYQEVKDKVSNFFAKLGGII